jgi:serine/threonine protein kinase
VWALGCLFYELLTGRFLFDETDVSSGNSLPIFFAVTSESIPIVSKQQEVRRELKRFSFPLTLTQVVKNTLENLPAFALKLSCSLSSSLSLLFSFSHSISISLLISLSLLLSLLLSLSLSLSLRL